LGDSIEKALKNGIVDSSSVLEYLGAKKGLLTLEKLRERVKNYEDGFIQNIKI
jgi:hypothetical protein